MEELELGGLMAEAFKLWLGNPDIAVAILSFTIFAGMAITAVQIYDDFKD